MAKLKCYSCPECGSFLEVDRVADTFDCPFCGNHFDVVDFHGSDLLEQAEIALKKCNYAEARQKYEYLLSKKPEELEFLYGYACAVGEVQSLDKFEDPKRYSKKLQSLFNNDPRYKTGPAAPYFAKLAEMFEISRKHTELVAKCNQKIKTAEDGIKSIKSTSEWGCGTAAYSICHYFFGAIFLGAVGQTGGSVHPAVIFGYVFIPIIILIIAGIVNAPKDAKLAEEAEMKKKPFYDMKTEANEMKKEIEALEESYERAFKAVPKLKAESGVLDIKEVRTELSEPAGRQLTNIPSRSPYSRRDPAVVAAELKKSHVCKKCGAELKLDQTRKLFICDHCGVSYDYERFYGDPKTKAKTCLKDGDFESADKWYCKILEEDPADFDANRGRILCAAKMYGFIQLKLSEQLMKVDWEVLDARINDAIVNTMAFKIDYFAEVKNLFDVAHEYYDVCVGLELGAQNENLTELLEKKKEIETRFIDKYKRFTDRERRIRALEAEKLSNKPDKMLAYRMRIIDVGRWESINTISPDESFVMGRRQMVQNVITEAKVNSTGDFIQYFNTWEVFVDVLEKYSKFKRELKNLKDMKDEAVALRIKEYEAQDETFRNGYNQTYNLLISLDNKLFYEKTDSKA